MQMMRPGPDVEEDERPEMDDRQSVGIDRPLGPLRNEVVHDGKEAGGQEESDRVVSIPPLEHRILNTAPKDVRLRSEDRHWNGRIISEMKDSDRDNEGKIKPVGNIDVRLLALDQRDQKHQEIGYPDNRQP